MTNLEAKHPFFVMPMINHLTGQRVDLYRFQAEKFIFTVQIREKRHKIFQVVFGKSDGSLYITFPYFNSQKGFLSTATFPNFTREAQINLEPTGKVTSHQVKYAHHPDGEVHFSQSGKVRTSIRRKCLPLAIAEGHLFTIQVQNISSFDEDMVSQDRPAKQTRTTLNFKFDGIEPGGIKFVARWHRPETFLLTSKVKDKVFGPIVPTQTPDRKVRKAYLVGTPSNFPLNDFLLAITCEGTDLLEKESKSLLMFIGGFDPPEIMNDPSKSFSFLYMSYPAHEYATLEKRLGSIDIN